MEGMSRVPLLTQRARTPFVAGDLPHDGPDSQSTALPDCRDVRIAAFELISLPLFVFSASFADFCQQPARFCWSSASLHLWLAWIVNLLAVAGFRPSLGFTSV